MDISPYNILLFILSNNNDMPGNKITIILYYKFASEFYHIIHYSVNSVKNIGVNNKSVDNGVAKSGRTERATVAYSAREAVFRIRNRAEKNNRSPYQFPLFCPLLKISQKHRV